MTREYKTRLTNHARQACQNDRNGFFEYPDFINLTIDNIIEVELINNEITKILIRIEYNNEYDLCLAVIPKNDGFAIVKTGWLNSKNDNHKTLDRSKYVS